MPQMSYSRSIAAGATDNPLSGAQYEFLPFPAIVRILQRTTATGVLCTVYSGSEAVQEESPVQSGGTAGVTPSPLNTSPMEFFAPAGDRLKVVNRNTTAGALTVDTLIQIDPVG